MVQTVDTATNEGSRTIGRGFLSCGFFLSFFVPFFLCGENQKQHPCSSAGCQEAWPLFVWLLFPADPPLRCCRHWDYGVGAGASRERGGGGGGGAGVVVLVLNPVPPQRCWNMFRVIVFPVIVPKGSTD